VKEGSEKFQGDQTKTNEEQAKKLASLDEIQERTDFAEQLGSVLEKCADFMGMVETKAEKADVKKLHARVEGGFSSIVVQMETERWLKAHADSVADGISQQFLGLVDQTCEKLSLRVAKVEKAMTDPGA